MNYKLSQNDKKQRSLVSAKKLLPVISGEKPKLIGALLASLITSAMSLLAPVIIGRGVDIYIKNNDLRGLLNLSAILFVVYIISLIANYLQIVIMGGVGRRILFKLRNDLFSKLSQLPIAFFNQNKAGDLISRINNDADKLNQFFSQALMQFIGSIFFIIISGILLLALNPKLGIATLLPAIFIFFITRIISPWSQRKNLQSLQTLGALSSEIQESLANFKVIIAFNRLDFFRDKFRQANKENYRASLKAGVASNIFIPIYTVTSSLAQLIVLAYGINLIYAGSFTIGGLISYLLYVNNFYSPLRQIAAIWPSFQLALAALDRIFEVLNLKSNIEVIGSSKPGKTGKYIIEFKKVYFSYPEGREVLKNINIKLEKGKTYALVGPTGGGKTTTASLMARLYDPASGTILFNNKDIRAYDQAQRSQLIGFILQEPFLFSGTIRNNIIYGNPEYQNCTGQQLQLALKNAELSQLLLRFPRGLETPVSANDNRLSLGQKQLVAFIRAVLRKPKLLILDEATANIDTVTEKLLDKIINDLPPQTTKVIIAHRLNTINNADQIFFINNQRIIPAGSIKQAIDMLMKNKSKS